MRLKKTTTLEEQNVIEAAIRILESTESPWVEADTMTETINRLTEFNIYTGEVEQAMRGYNHNTRHLITQCALIITALVQAIDGTVGEPWPALADDIFNNYGLRFQPHIVEFAYANVEDIVRAYVNFE